MSAHTSILGVFEPGDGWLFRTPVGMKYLLLLALALPPIFIFSWWATLAALVLVVGLFLGPLKREVPRRAPTPLRETVARMVTGDADASAGVKEALATLGVLVGAMIHGIPQAGLVAERRMETFAPKTIESIIGPGPIWVNKETRMWNKYVELWQAAEGGRLRHEILSAIAQHVEALMNNR